MSQWPRAGSAAGRQLRNSKLWIVVALSLASAVTLVPIVSMLLASFKPDSEIMTTDPSLFPVDSTTANYAALFEQFSFGQLTVNSVIITVAVIALSTLLGGLAAYGLSRHPFRGDSLVLGVLLLTRLVTPAALVVPLYLVMERLGLLNSPLSVIIGITVLNLPFVIWVLKPFFDALPHEVEEAALLDGLTPAWVFIRIAIPLALPGLFTVVLLSFIAGWTDLLFPMSFITTIDAQPLTSGLLQMQTGYKIYWGPLMAGGVFILIPTLFLAVFLQRYLVRGMRLGY